MAVFESHNDVDEAKKYFELVGQDVLWHNLHVFVEHEISESFLKALLKCPDNHSTIISTASDFEKQDKLSMISDIVLADDCFPNEDEIIVLKLKLLAESSDELFLKAISSPKMVIENFYDFLINF